MTMKNMDGGYINEGGQLKSKNGQKYIINQPIKGFYLSKQCAALLIVLAILTMAAIFLLTYFFVVPRCSSSYNVRDGVNVSSAGLLSGGRNLSDSGSNGVLADQSTITDGQYFEFVLNDGWSPILYKLVIEPDLIAGSSRGNVWIDIVKDTPSKNDWPPIVLDINNITITDVKVYQSSSEQMSPVDIRTKYGKQNETYIIELDKGYNKVGNVTFQLQLDFISQLTDTLQGFYRTSYQHEETGEKTWLASTQFSPIDARRAFPCFDRPDKKAQFQISIIHKEEKTVTLSNMPSSRKSIPQPGYIQEDFDITPKMSTYLVAFIVSDLVNTNVSQYYPVFDGPQINIYTRPEVFDMTRYVYTLTTQILPFMEEYFDNKFKLPKIDMVAVPDFGFSAMENWGLITFRESAILVPEDEERRSSADHTERVASILAHELAHQWFGNLVTMKWWDDLWLKEGFATYMSYLALEKVEPRWQMMHFFPINELQKSMEKDSDKSSHPISFPVSTSADIRRIFDPISYSKGASIIRMMNSFLGERAFRGAIREYLKQFEYGNAVHDDLWSVMTEHGHKHDTLPRDLTVKKIMDTWTVQAGYPVVSLERSGTNVTLTQQRYMLPHTDVNDMTRWFIPITFETEINRQKSEMPVYWMDNQKSITIPNIVEPDHWIYLNIKRSGYYRVNYDYDSWKALAKNYEKLPPVTRAQLLDDALHLARADLISYDIPLTLLMKLGYGFDDVLAWAASTKGLEYVTYMLTREPAYEHFRAIMRFLLKQVYDHTGFDEHKNETHVELMHRYRIVQQTCFFGHDRCTNRAQILFREWMRDKALNKISPNLKDIIYCTALREGSFQEWYFAHTRYTETTSASEKEIILSALGCSTKPWLLSKYLNMTISSTSGIRKQDGARAFIAVARNSVGYEIAFDFLITNIKEISEYFGDGFSTLSKMIDSVTTYMNKDYQLEQFKKFAKKAHDLGLTAIERNIQLAIEQVQNNIAWRSKSYYQLQTFLEILLRQWNINLY